MNSQENYKRVLESLKLLAASYEDQVRYLPEFADVPDDVTATFENSFLLLPQLIEEGKFTNQSIASLLRTYNKMQWCLRNITLDDFSSVEWSKLRDLSKAALRQIGEPIEKPDLKFI